MMAAFGVGFLFPVLLVFLQLAGRAELQAAARAGGGTRSVVIVVIAAVITPSGDPISMLALGIPMYVFYWISVAHRLARQPAPGQGHRRPAVGTA